MPSIRKKNTKRSAPAASPSAHSKKERPVAAVTPDHRQLILAAVRKIPRGKVSSYGDVAEVAGLPRRARLVGTVLRDEGTGGRQG